MGLGRQAPICLCASFRNGKEWWNGCRDRTIVGVRDHDLHWRRERRDGGESKGCGGRQRRSSLGPNRRDCIIARGRQWTL